MAKISTLQLANYAVDELEKGSTSKTVALKLASYLLEERRSREMPAIIRAIDKELALRGSTQVTVISAHETSAEIKAQLATLLGAKNPVFSNVIDPSVIGGVKARAGESEIDLTVRGKLNRFKANIVNQEN